MSDIGLRLERVRSRIADACDRASRDASSVTLVAVSKTHAARSIAEAYAAGQRDFGENRVQEGATKIEELRATGVTPVWHLLGHLQGNKVRAALSLFDILHGVDSERLGEAISARADRPVRVFLEVNIAGEATKQGVPPPAAPALAEAIGRLPNIELAGLMTVAPMVDDPEDVRPVFRTLRELRDAIGLRELSMGMTDDYEVAVEEGATVVRIGRAIFGPREG
ncbi:MAG: YggS family pyridoxal phosphate-dependent enzyme [Dehalococcoidia bacterium]